MQYQTTQAQDAHKSECQMPSLAQVIKRLKAEAAMVNAELKSTPTDSLFNARGWHLINREQELHTTLTVLEGMTQQPKTIEEPTH